MPKSLYGCGFDGFSQVSSFLLTDADNSSSKEKPDQRKRNAKILWPLLLLNLNETHTVYSNAMTWAQVVVTIKKGTKLVKLKASKSTCNEVNYAMKFELDPIITGISIKDVSCGKEHVMLLGENGAICSYGFGSRGQLGHNSIEEKPSPTLIEALDGLHMKAIAAGGWHSAAISDIGDLYMWGWNESGQLGISLVNNEGKYSGNLSFDDTVQVQAEPLCIGMNEDLNAVAVACGARHTTLLSDDGKVYACGWNGYGQLGLGHLESQKKFTEVEALQKLICVDIFAGQWNTFFVCEIK